jgi:hypothetical protein
MIPSRRFHAGLCLLLTVLMLLPSCAGMSPRHAGFVDEAADPCRAQRVVLAETDNYFAESIATGAVTGALMGVAAAALSGRRSAGSLVGSAMLGGVAGGTAGYWLRVREQAKNDQALYASMLKDLRAENTQIDRTQLAFDQLVQCRRQEADRVRADFVAGRIDESTARTRMAAVRQRYDQDLEKARAISQKVGERSTNFQFANEQVNPQPVLAVRDGALRSEPAVTAPEIGRIAAGTIYSASRTNDTWSKVILPNGLQGFVETSALSAPPKPGAPAVVPAPTQTVATTTPDRQEIAETTSTNLAKRDRLAESVQVASRDTSAFELSPKS